jgi:hypothetical protein
MATTSLVDILSKILSIYSIFILVIGTLGNVIAAFICLTKELRSRNTFRFLAVLSLVDSLALYEWNLKYFTVSFYNVNWERRSLVWCRASIFLQQTSLQTSSWILVGNFALFYKCNALSFIIYKFLSQGLNCFGSSPVD